MFLLGIGLISAVPLTPGVVDMLLVVVAFPGKVLLPEPSTPLQRGDACVSQRWVVSGLSARPVAVIFAALSSPVNVQRNRPFEPS